MNVFTRKKVWVGFTAVLVMAGIVWAYVPVREVGPLVGYTQAIQSSEQQNASYNEQRQQWLKKIDKVKIDVRNANQQLSDKVGPKLDACAALIFSVTPYGSTMDRAPNQPKTLEQEVEDQVHFVDDIVNLQGEIEVHMWDNPPLWTLNYSGLPQSSSWHLPLRLNRIIKTAQSANADDRLLNMIGRAAETLLPEGLMQKLNLRRVTSFALEKAGVVQIAEGIFLRDRVPQDEAFMRYANLNCDHENEILFWSDPMVAEGFHPILGDALNATPLKGYRPVDMDNLLSRGYSQAIERVSLLKSKEMENPFRGYASRVIPGLILMSKRGQLTPGEMPTDAQLQTAMKLSKKMNVLPSQVFNIQKPISFRENGYHFRYPKVVKTAGDTNPVTASVGLDKLNEDVHKMRMALAKERLEELVKLRRENEKAQDYATQVIEKNKQLASSLRGINPIIPEIAQMRVEVFESIGRWQEILSDLEHDRNQIRQKEWVIQEHAVEVRRRAILVLMDNAAVRYRMILKMYKDLNL